MYNDIKLLLAFTVHIYIHTPLPLNCMFFHDDGNLYNSNMEIEFPLIDHTQFSKLSENGNSYYERLFISYGEDNNFT